jgi:hypothetical protein
MHYIIRLNINIDIDINVYNTAINAVSLQIN